MNHLHFLISKPIQYLIQLYIRAWENENKCSHYEEFQLIVNDFIHHRLFFHLMFACFFNLKSIGLTSLCFINSLFKVIPFYRLNLILLQEQHYQLLRYSAPSNSYINTSVFNNKLFAETLLSNLEKFQLFWMQIIIITKIKIFVISNHNKSHFI